MFERGRLLASRCPGERTRVEQDARVVPLLANAYLLCGESEKCRAVWREFIQATLQADRTDLAADAVLELSCLTSTLDPGDALRGADLALKLSAGLDHLQFRALSELHRHHMRLVFRDWSSVEAAEALRLAAELRSSGLQTHRTLPEYVESVIQLYRSDYESSLAGHRTLRDLAVREDDAHLFEGAQRGICMSLRALGRWDQLLAECAGANRPQERGLNLSRLAHVEIQLACLYLDCFDFERVLSVCESLLPSASRQPHLTGCISALRARACAAENSTSAFLSKRAATNSSPLFPVSIV